MNRITDTAHGMTHSCVTNSESEFNPISRCCGIQAGNNTPLTVCPSCGRLTAWECGDCGATEWVPKGIENDS